MKISGSSTLEAPVDKVWEAMLDPAVLARFAAAAASVALMSASWYWRRSVTSCNVPETRIGWPSASRSHAPRERNQRYSPFPMRSLNSMS